MPHATTSLDIATLEAQCRQALQYDSVFEYLKKQGEAFNEICALLDFVGDSEGALGSIDSIEKRRKLEPYLLAYGLLQTAYTRQISLLKVLETLKIPIPAGLKKNSIVKPRDRIVGHPIRSDGGAHVILRNSLSANGFEYASYYPKEVKRGNVIKYDALLTEHAAIMKEGLAVLLQRLAQIENDRRKQMRQSPLSPIFQGTEYIARCLAAATVEEKYEMSIDGNLRVLGDALSKFRDGLIKRYGEERSSYHVDSVIIGLQMLKELYPWRDDSVRLRFDLVSYAVENKVGELIGLAKEIDDTESQAIG